MRGRGRKGTRKKKLEDLLRGTFPSQNQWTKEKKRSRGRERRGREGFLSSGLETKWEGKWA